MKKINLIVICLNTLFLILNAFILFKNLDNEKHEKSNTQNSSYSHSKNINEPNIHNSRASSRQKACYSNMRVLASAVEMYNMDHVPMMVILDQNALKSARYIKSKCLCPGGAEKEYKTLGRLDKDGVICCGEEPIGWNNDENSHKKYHGTIDGNSTNTTETNSKKIRKKGKIK